ncbi:MAG: glycoside hydrolase family 9 protein [Oscillospiraceae bacterium]|nr:glycoside hydrolase family 9 protein [Oscillospiraceae bacterium]
MKKTKRTKRILSAAMSACMLACCTAMPICTASAAGYPMIQSDFEDGVGLPWHCVTTRPAQLDFNITDGSYNVQILNNGGRQSGFGGRTACQFRHRALNFHAGYKYHVHAEVTSDHDGEIFVRIGDLGGGDDIWHNSMGATDEAVGYEGTDNVMQSWDCLPVKAGETLVIDAEFMPEKDLVSGEWAFEFGAADEYQPVDCFPEGTILKFDNLKLDNLTDDGGCIDPVERYKVKPFAVNQLGYLTDMAKVAILHADSTKSFTEDFYVMDANTDKVVFKGEVSRAKNDENAGQFAACADFSAFRLPGTYYLSQDGKTRASLDFKIGDNIYEGVMKDAVNYFYQNRAGVPVTEEYITSTGANEMKQPLAHAKSDEFKDTGYVQQKWQRYYYADSEIKEIKASGLTQTAEGGWFEAENYSKSVINGANALWMLQNLYERAAVSGEEARFSESKDEIVTPEHDNGIPDILDEAKFELDFLMSMMIPEDSGYKLSLSDGRTEFGDEVEDTGKYAGMLYHQIQDSKWTGLAEHAWDYISSKDYSGMERIIKPPTTTATLAGAAVFAQASRLFKQYDADYAKKLLECAETAFKAAKANPALYPPYDAFISSRTTGDSNVSDDFYWAACELYLTTEDAAYLKEIEDSPNYAYRLDSVLNGGENCNTATSFNWGGTGGYGTLSLALHKDLLGKENKEKLEASIAEAADHYLMLENMGAFSVPYEGREIPIGPGIQVGGFENDSNGIITNNAIVLAYAYDLTGEMKYYQGALTAMDYIFGRNPIDTSYVTGYGSHAAQNPHHKFWAHEIDSYFPYAPAGVMVSGPNTQLDDPIVKGMGLKRGQVPSMLCYYDSVEAWSVNSCSLTLNASLAWMMGFLSDGSGENAIVYQTGDLNGDEKTTAADAVLMVKFLSMEGSLNKGQYEAADLNKDKQVNAIDLTLLKQQLMKGDK